MYHYTVTETQVQLPDTTEANALEAGADVKGSGLFSSAGHLEDGGLTSQSPSPLLSGGFIRRERRTEQTDQGRGSQSSLCAYEHSPF